MKCDDFLLKRHFKDVSPSETIEAIQKTLQALGLNTEEIWSTPTSINTYSVRLRVTGIPMEIGANGKGSDKEYARASAYGELCERLQNQLFVLSRCYATEKRKEYIDEQYMSISEALERDSYFFPLLTKILYPFSINNSVPKIEVLETFFGGKMIRMRPFYSWKQHKLVWIPWEAVGKFYGSNGMSAGNTMEEALVQGLSEIVERHVQRTIMKKPRALPDIPEKYIKKYDYIYEMYLSLKSAKGYELLLKDCSLGEGYPVIGLILINKKTNCFGVKLGCHPNIGIAMERCFTEAFQGMSEETFSGTSKFDMSNRQTEHDLNIYNTYKTAYGQYPWEILQDTDALANIREIYLQSQNNRDMLLTMITLIESKGYDILFRDVSFLGVPSYQVIVPGISELLPITGKLIRASKTMARVSELLKQPQQLTPEDCHIINLNCRFWKNSILENNLGNIYNLPLNIEYQEGLPGNKHGYGLVFMEAMTWYAQGKIKEALRAYKEWLSREEYFEDKLEPFYYALFHFLVSVEHGVPQEVAFQILQKFFTLDDVEHVSRIFSEPEQCMGHLYPAFNCYNCCKCSMDDKCGYTVLKDIMGRLWDRQLAAELNQNTLMAHLELLQTQQCKYNDESI